MDNLTNNFWENTYRQNISKMIGVCWRYTQDRQTAEDLAHDAFVVAIGKVSSFENKGPFEAWLRRIVVNVALQHLRQQKIREKLAQGAAYPAAYEVIQEENPDCDHFSFSETELLEVIANLPEHHRLVFNLYVIDNLTHGEIAAQLGISEGTSKSHLARARKKVRELLSAQIREKKGHRKWFPLLFLPFQFRNIDEFVSRELGGLQIQPLKGASFQTARAQHALIPKWKPAGSGSTFLSKTAIWGTSAVVIFCGFLIFDDLKNKNIGKPEIVQEDQVIQKNMSDLTANHKEIRAHIFSDTNTATISGNSIIVEKTKNGEPMKNLSTLGGLLIAGLSFDTANLVKELPVTLKNRDIEAHQIVRLPADVRPDRTKAKLSHGTFYASQLFWSDENKVVYLLGENVKVNFNTNKFVGSGRFSFLDNVNHMVVDGVPVNRNETVDLAKKKYNLRQLNEADGLKKYGDSGKGGVVEITLAE
ncbi:RNA polymerase sigma factor [Dyadobacter sp. CY323]|uniref:RNA polymerase sigma factor n=1 Tax=Dyadobacter sp. CY323 TaxID=2907302 RepID=UPI001F20BD51|nr:RNA polymerase sigma factor [Dyadobacter sp. CY323]MCE6989803.1 RNA polymerase sigma factor [Dyadobacter sp. CY323]